MSRRHEVFETPSHLIGEAARIGLGQSERLGALAQLQQSPLFVHRRHVPREGAGGDVEQRLLAHRPHQRAQGGEILADAARPLVPQRRIAHIAEHEKARLEPDQGEHRIVGGRGPAERRQDAQRDVAVDGREVTDGPQAQDAHADEDHDHERRSEKDLGRELHADALSGSSKIAETSPSVAPITVGGARLQSP